MIIPLGEYLPDMPPAANPGSLVVTNVIPGPNSSYLPFPGLNQVAAGGLGRVQGAFYARDNANNTYTYAGDSSALYVQSGLSLNAATRISGGAYTTNIDDFWEFVSWGQTVIGVNGNNDAPQQISLGAANFVDIAGAPKARHIAVINNFVVLGNVSDSATNVQRVRWSAINNSGSWTPDPATLADFQDLQGNGGWIQKVISGETGGYIFQERAIWQMVFIGSPLIFQFQKMQDGVGAYAPQSVVNLENICYFLAADGFKAFDGTNLNPIGQGKIDATFYADLDPNYFYRVQGLIVPQNKMVMWAYPGAGNSNGNPNRMLIFSWAYNRWALVDNVNIEMITMSSSHGYTLDGLDAVSSSLDALAYSLDSRNWTGGVLAYSAYVNGKLYYFNGPAMDAEVVTTESNLKAQTFPGRPGASLVQGKAMISEIWPLVETGGNASASVGVAVITRNTLKDAPATTVMAIPPTSAGFVQAHVTANYFRFSLQTSGDFDFLQGVDVTFVNGGKR